MAQSGYSNEIIAISDKEFELISGLIYEKFGIKLTSHKKTLVEGRLNKLLKQMNFRNFKEYYDYIIHDDTANSLILLIDRISTNHTFFYREKAHFNFLKEYILPELTQRLKNYGRKNIRIWCAGCATGEESYTIAMVLNDYFKIDFYDWDIGILATDISISAIYKARQGIYSIDKLKELPFDYRQKYFKEVDNQTFEVKDFIKEKILYKRLNLMNSEFPFKNKFDIIFCRNVMIYFDNQTRKELINKFAKYINNGGYFFIGHSESLGRDNKPFFYIMPAVYRKREVENE